VTTEELMCRLIVEFPTWSNEQAWTAATRIVAYSEQMQFQLDVERDLDALPITKETTWR